MALSSDSDYIAVYGAARCAHTFEIASGADNNLDQMGSTWEVVGLSYTSIMTNKSPYTYHVISFLMDPNLRNIYKK